MPRHTAPRRALLLALLTLLGLLLATPATAEEMGLLMVTCPVEGAEVWVDGAAIGTVPFTGYVPVGRHEIRVVADNFDPFVRRKAIEAGLTTKLEAALAPGRGTFEIVAQPAGAIVSIDGNEQGPAPLRIGEISPGHHRWSVSAPGFETQAQEFEFATGRNLYFNISLRSSRGLFAFTSTPSGAAVWLDGAEVGRTPLELEDIPPAEHRVHLALDGYAHVFRTVDTRDGSKGLVEVGLSTGGTKVVVLTGHDDATVTSSDEVLGTGRKVVLPAVERCRLPLVVTAPGQDPAELTLAVTGHGSVSAKATLGAASSGASRLVQRPPVYARWTFWTATAGVAAVGATGGVVLAQALAPPPLPEGDVLVVLP
ncbi:MAG: PEGA domain-containing protein [Pseudomonadota bacterium]